MDLTKPALVSLLYFFASLMTTAQASVVWNWSFETEAGQFITDGNSSAPGIYTLSDFSVTSSGTGGTIGSLSGGEYKTDNYLATLQPFTLIWDGFNVAQWLHSGLNSFDWWSFYDIPTSISLVDRPWRTKYFFGWDTNNINDPTRAAHWDGNNSNPLAVGDITVSPVLVPIVSSVPVPAAVWLFGSGLLGLMCIARRKLLIP